MYVHCTLYLILMLFSICCIWCYSLYLMLCVIKACRIPEDKATPANYAAGVGFMQGNSPPLHVQQLQGSSRDATDHRESDEKGKDEEIISSHWGTTIFWQPFVTVYFISWVPSQTIYVLSMSLRLKNWNYMKTAVIEKNQTNPYFVFYRFCWEGICFWHRCWGRTLCCCSQWGPKRLYHITVRNNLKRGGA